MGSTWRLEMLGTLQAVAHGRTVSRFRTRRVAMLFAYLALHGNRAHAREEVADLLWPEADESAARRNLRQAVHSLRQVLEPPHVEAGSILRVDQSLISLNPREVATDVEELESSLREARALSAPEARLTKLQQAIALYKGDLLPGIDELWVLNERLRMEDLYLSALKMAVADSVALGQTDAAIQLLRLAIAKEPLDEDLHTTLMRQYLLAGRPRSAVQQYEELAALLEAELNCQPEPKAQQLAAEAARKLGAAKVGKSRSSLTTPAAKPTPAPSDPQSTIPVTMTRFFGRQAETERIRELITGQSVPLLTVLGPAGTGKTRLSIEVARALADEGWQTWFVPLAELESGHQVVGNVADVLRPTARNDTPLQDIQAALGHAKSLLVLDNLEHIIDTAVPAVAQIVEALPTTAVLVTSRQSLNIAAEVQFPVGPLPLPDQALGPIETREQLAEVAACPSVQMLVDRCQAIRPDVQITLQNARHFVSICNKLEGIPLALEIAAGLSKSSVPSQIVKQIDNRLLALTSRRRDAPIRHQSLRAAIEYSFHTLPSDLHALMTKLAVFRGGFSVTSATQVCLPEADAETCLQRLFDLQERSLIQSEQSEQEGAPLRFRMLESFREYAESLLTPAETADLRQSHAAFYAGTALADDQANDPAARARLHVLIKHDHSNYIAAAEYLVRERQIGLLIRLLTALSTAWDIRGTSSIELELVRRAVALPESGTAQPVDRIRLYRINATTYLRNAEFQAAYKSCEQALEVAKALDDPRLIAECSFGMSLCAGYLGQTTHCIELCRQVLAHAPASDRVLLERTYVSIGSAHWAIDGFDEAEEAFQQARQISQEFRGEPDGLILAHIAGLAIDQGRLQLAMVTASEGLRISRRRDDDISMAACLAQIARYHLERDNVPAAVATSVEALAKVRQVGIQILRLEVLQNHAFILGKDGRLACAVTLLGATTGLGSVQRNADHRRTARILDDARASLEPRAFEDAWARGLAMPVGEAFSYALAGC